MNILIVTGIFPPDHGGPASYTFFIARELIAKGIGISGIVTLSDQIDFKNELDIPVVRILRKSPRLFRMFKTISIIYKMSKDADVVYLNGLVLEGIIACKLLSRTPVVIKVVGDLIWEKYKNSEVSSKSLSIENFQYAKLPIYWACLRRLQSLYTRLADRVIVPSNFLGKIVKIWGVKPKNIFRVFNTSKPFKEKCNKNIIIEYDLITVARLVPWKGILELINVSHNLNLRLLVIGDGPLRSLLEDEVNKTKANVTFINNVPHAEVSRYIKKAKLFVLNSSYEGLPHIVLEAKLAKTAVIATNAGGTPETINHNIDGWLVPVGDTLSLKNGISHILSNPNIRNRLAIAGYEHVRKNFSIKNQVEQTIYVLQSVNLKCNSKS